MLFGRPNQQKSSSHCPFGVFSVLSVFTELLFMLSQSESSLSEFHGHVVIFSQDKSNPKIFLINYSLNILNTLNTVL